MDGERKKVSSSIKRQSWRLEGIYWLFYVLFDDAFLFYELNHMQQQQQCISLLLPFTVLALSLACSLSLITPALSFPHVPSLSLKPVSYFEKHPSCNQLAGIFWNVLYKTIILTARRGGTSQDKTLFLKTHKDPWIIKHLEGYSPSAQYYRE